MLDTLWGNIFRHRLKGEERIIDSLRAIPIFGELSDRELRIVEKLVYIRRYAAGEAIFGAGDPSLGMYIVKAGSVQIVRDIPGAQPKLIAVLTAGDFFGEMGLIDDGPRSASAFACGATETIGFFKPELMSLTSRQPQLGLKIFLRVAKTLSSRLRETHQALDEHFRKHERKPDFVHDNPP
jgi:CRP-like cAMP-binding protein